ncbi:pH-response regulator protein palI/RIM9 [Paramicrosporidium saccamoebae]|uniref:pH-response regulator protein palI/RIM9 n=1 Tax=Paramicrosporidium saccamoebae TaxID=1246581 RepID=A0A2H9TKS2_9FUNG|nr:pH-response regulator protein palI/RIM9 [Paramicrosporidium saccamoebae]
MILSEFVIIAAAYLCTISGQTAPIQQSLGPAIPPQQSPDIAASLQSLGSRPLNATHEIKCTVMQRGSCEKVQQEIQTTMGRTSWWHCSGDLYTCLSRLDRDMRSNLLECKSICSQHALPEHLSNLRALVLKSSTLEGDSTCTMGFTTAMELLANVLVQKSRFCHFDIELYARLIDQVDKASKMYTQCSGEQTQRITQQSGGSVQQSGGSFQQSGGSFQQSGGSFQQSGGSVQQSQGSFQQSNGGSQQSNGGSQQSNGGSQQSNGGFQQSQQSGSFQ